VITISGVKHWLWRAVDQNGMVLDILVQSRRDTQTAKRLLCKLLKRQCRVPQCHDHRPDMVAIQRRFSFEVRQPVQWRRIQPRA